MNQPLAHSSLPPSTPDDLAAGLEDLFARGTPENTLRAYERDFAYLSAWKQATLGAAMTRPEQEDVALRFILDHARDLSDAPEGASSRALSAQSALTPNPSNRLDIVGGRDYADRERYSSTARDPPILSQGW